MTDPRPRASSPPRLALRKSEAAAALGLSDESFDKYARSELRVVRVGSMRLYPIAELERWLRDRAAPAPVDELEGRVVKKRRVVKKPPPNGKCFICEAGWYGDCPKPCEQCGGVFKPDRATSKFCSKACAGEARARCGGPKTVEPPKIAVMPKMVGDRRKNARGYIWRYEPDHPKASKSGWILEHRYVMAEHLGRPLTSDEVVHHINRIKDDNRVENLRVMTAVEHNQLHREEARNGQR